MKVSVSVLSATDRILCIKKLNRTNLDYFHIDAMDGKFVNNYQMPVKEILEISKYTKKPLDIHLMVENPLKYIDKLIELPIEYITFHIELAQDIEELINECKNKGYKVGLAIKPDTSIKRLKPYLKLIDLILIMSVEPGFGGQKFLESTYDKIIEIKELLQKNNVENILLEVDGGINNSNISKLKELGIDIAVSGSYIINHQEFQKQIDTLR